MRQISLTGIKPTGDLHIGNFFGAMRPALQLAESYEARYFIADYHALNSVKDAAELRTHIRAVAAGWLAAGLDPDKVIFYRQSAVPETFELSTLLMATGILGKILGPLVGLSQYLILSLFGIQA